MISITRASIFSMPFAVIRDISYTVYHYMDICMRSCVNNYALGDANGVDSCMAPILFIPNNCISFLGSVLLVTVIVLSSFIVLMFYLIILPYYWHRNMWIASICAIVGTWILINYVFHYYMAVNTSPGHPPSGVLPEVTDFCKKCNCFKPPRAHHCSVCDSCVLKMDHHCPWINTCVGHWNHRYFYSFVMFAVIGSLFLILPTFETLRHTSNISEDYYINDIFHNPFDIVVGYPMEKHSDLEQIVLKVHDSDDMNSALFRTQVYLMEMFDFRFKGLIFMLSLVIFTLIGTLILCVWNTHLIVRGQTNIDLLVHKKKALMARKRGEKCKMEHNFGFKNNWKIFFGLYDGRTFWRHVLFPSTHLPLGDGIVWPKDVDEVLDILNGKKNEIENFK